jgi:hypothetical protein
MMRARPATIRVVRASLRRHWRRRKMNWGIDREYWMDAIVIVVLAILFLIVIPK